MTRIPGLYEVGKVASSPFWPHSPKQDGALMEQLKDTEGGYGIFFVFYLSNPELREIDGVRQSPLHLKYISEGPFFLGLVMCGNDIRMLFDFTYDPTIRPPEEYAERMSAWQIQNLASIFLIDTDDGRIRALRAATMPYRFRKAFLGSLARVHNPEYSRLYADWLAHQYERDITSAWKYAENGGTFGE